MPFVQKAELPISLHAAYDIAAKGVDNDDTRTNKKNDETIIDSEKELLIFKEEVDKLNENNCLDKLTYDAIMTKINDMQDRINSIKYSMQSHDRTSEFQKSEWQKHLKAKEEYKKYEKEHPLGNFFHSYFDIWTLGLHSAFSEWGEMKRYSNQFNFPGGYFGFIEAPAISEEKGKQMLNALW